MTASVQINDTGSTVTVQITEGSVQIGTPTSTAHNSLALRTAAGSHPATAISNTPAGGIAATTVQAAIDELDGDKANNPITVSGNITAANNGAYIVIASCTITDPTPSVGANYIVHVRNGTATIGGVGYAAGQDVHRVWHSGSWASTPMPSRAASVTNGRLTEFDASGNLQNSAVQDGVTGGVATLAATLTGNVSYTFPPSSITVAGINLAQTWTADQTFGNGTGAPMIRVNGAASNNRAFEFLTNNARRWGVRCRSDTESGANAGSSWTLSAYDDAGSFLDSPIDITRASGGAITLARPVTVTTGVVTVPNGTAAAPGLRLTSEASGLYRVSSTSLGFSVAGTAAASLTSSAVLTLDSGANGATLAVGTTAGGSGAINVYRNTVPSIAMHSGSGGIIRLQQANSATATLQVTDSTGATVYFSVTPTVVACTATTASTSTTTGALVVSGGLGVAGQATVRRIAYAVGTIATTGAIAALASDDGFTRLTGAAPDIQGIANPGTVAERIILYCVNATTLRHENVTATAANRITSDTGADITVAAGKTVELIYDPTSTRWRPIRF